MSCQGDSDADERLYAIMLYDRFMRFLDREGLDLSGTVLVGISGGVDSVVLVELASRVASGVVGLHVNYGLRGRESDDDAVFVQDLCQRLNVELVTVDAKEEMEAVGGRSTQEEARRIRYRAFANEARSRGVETVLLGHHGDDQVETVLMNLFRGAGIRGLAGMPVSRPLDGGTIRIVRPLLFARRSDIESYALHRGLRWRDDSSNRDARYRRVTVRHELIPLIERTFGSATPENILRTSRLAQKTVEAQTAGGQTPDARSDISRFSLSTERLKNSPSAVQTTTIIEALRRVLPRAPRSAKIADRIASLIDAQAGRRVEFGQAAVVRERDALVFVADREEIASTPDFSHRLRPGTAVPVPGGLVMAQRLAEVPGTLDVGTHDVAIVDEYAVGPEMEVTLWQEGDRMRPLGSTGTTKVSDILTDQKTPHLARRSTVVVRASGRVVWVVGLRLSGDYAITPETRSALLLCYLRQGR